MKKQKKASIQIHREKIKRWKGRARLPFVASDQLVDPKVNVTIICLRPL